MIQRDNILAKFPELRFPEFHSRWEIRKMNELAEIIMGQSPDSASYNSHGVGEYLIQGNADIQNRETFPRNWTSNPTKRCIIGDIILTVRAPVGAVAKSLHNACIGRGVCVIRNRSISDGNFLYQFLLNFESKWGNIEQGSTFTAVNTADIKNLSISVPSIKEQQKISSFLQSIDRRIEKFEQKKQLLEEYKKGVIQKIFSGEIKFKNKDNKAFPKWKRRRFGEVANFLKGKGISKNEISEDGKIPCIRYGELYTCYKESINIVVSKTNLAKADLVLSKANDVIIPSSGETHIDIAKASCVCKSGIALGGDINIIRTEHNGLFLAYYLNNVKRNEIAQLAQGSSVVHLYAKELRQLLLDLPVFDEQLKIANFLLGIDNEIENIQRIIDGNRQFKKGLLQQMFI